MNTSRSDEGLPLTLKDKDPGVEELLSLLNECLSASHEAVVADDPPDVPTLHVVGVPRSGTTLAAQVLISRLNIGYIDNLAASFWRVPVFGLRLSDHLVGSRSALDFESSYGRTNGPEGLHEFGYFWRDQLGQDSLNESDSDIEAVDWVRLRRTINAICREVGKPMLFKSFLLIWYLEQFQAVLPSTCIVWIRRDREAVARSLLGFREQMHGSREQWVSLRPAVADDVEHLPAGVQVAHQVVGIENRLRRASKTIPRRQWLEIPFARLCADPESVVDDCASMITASGGMVSRRGKSIKPFSPPPETPIKAQELSDMRTAFAQLLSR